VSPQHSSGALWADALTGPARAPLPGDRDADVAIVGGGFTGLWTALELRRRDPSLRIAVIEREQIGFGASGRNGGWCSALLPMGISATSPNPDAARALARAMVATVEGFGTATEELGIDCDFRHDGWLQGAMTRAQVRRLHEELAEAERWGLSGPRWLDRTQARDRLAIDGLLGAVFTPHCAVLHPGKLVRGLADAAQLRGIDIYEHTAAVELVPGAVHTDRGRVRADVVVRATEAFTRSLSGMRRDLAPIYSLMIATEPLPPSVWDAIGWRERFAYNDARNLIIYAQRTADDRIALGGRGAPYHFGSRIDPRFDRVDSVHEALTDTLHRLFPVTRDHAITHRWGGPLGAPRDWHCSVGFDRQRSLAWAGGYVGDGVATSNLAGRTLADLICGHDTELTRLPWVGHESRRWEPEPLRWLGINGALAMTASVDRAELAGRPARWRQRALQRLLGV
jgi:glycine/D-amino acid oxidase-like deaminating enzyme